MDRIRVSTTLVGGILCALVACDDGGDGGDGGEGPAAPGQEDSAREVTTPLAPEAAPAPTHATHAGISWLRDDQAARWGIAVSLTSSGDLAALVQGGKVIAWDDAGSPRFVHRLASEDTSWTSVDETGFVFARPDGSVWAGASSYILWSEEVGLAEAPLDLVIAAVGLTGDGEVVRGAGSGGAGGWAWLGGVTVGPDGRMWQLVTFQADEDEAATFVVADSEGAVEAVAPHTGPGTAVARFDPDLRFEAVEWLGPRPDGSIVDVADWSMHVLDGGELLWARLGEGRCELHLVRPESGWAGMLTTASPSACRDVTPRPGGGFAALAFAYDETRVPALDGDGPALDRSSGRIHLAFYEPDGSLERTVPLSGYDGTFAHVAELGFDADGGAVVVARTSNDGDLWGVAHVDASSGTIEHWRPFASGRARVTDLSVADNSDLAVLADCRLPPTLPHDLPPLLPYNCVPHDIPSCFARTFVFRISSEAPAGRDLPIPTGVSSW